MTATCQYTDDSSRPYSAVPAHLMMGHTQRTGHGPLHSVDGLRGRVNCHSTAFVWHRHCCLRAQHLKYSKRSSRGCSTLVLICRLLIRHSDSSASHSANAPIDAASAFEPNDNQVSQLSVSGPDSCQLESNGYQIRKKTSGACIHIDHTRELEIDCASLADASQESGWGACLGLHVEVTLRPDRVAGATDGVGCGLQGGLHPRSLRLRLHRALIPEGCAIHPSNKVARSWAQLRSFELAAALRGMHWAGEAIVCDAQHVVQRPQGRDNKLAVWF